MSILHDDPRLDDPRDEPPMLRARGNDGSTVTEPLTHVGIIGAPRSARDELELYEVCMTYARFDSRAGRWEGCLLSEQALRVLLELRAEGQFPYALEAVPSQAEAGWQVAKAAGATERLPMPLRAFVTAASPEALVKLKAVSGGPSGQVSAVPGGQEQR